MAYAPLHSWDDVPSDLRGPLHALVGGRGAPIMLEGKPGSYEWFATDTHFVDLRAGANTVYETAHIADLKPTGFANHASFGYGGTKVKTGWDISAFWYMAIRLPAVAREMVITPQELEAADPADWAAFELRCLVGTDQQAGVRPGRGGTLVQYAPARFEVLLRRPGAATGTYHHIAPCPVCGDFVAFEVKNGRGRAEVSLERQQGGSLTARFMIFAKVQVGGSKAALHDGYTTAKPQPFRRQGPVRVADLGGGAAGAPAPAPAQPQLQPRPDQQPQPDVARLMFTDAEMAMARVRHENGAAASEPAPQPQASAPAPSSAPAPPPAGPPPNWYADPHGQARLRWWDGTAWTHHTAA